MMDMQVFKYNGNEVRTVLRDGQPWWVLKDVCDVLGLSNATEVAKRLDSDERDVFKTKSDLVLNIPNRGITIVNESGLYNVILRSDKPEAHAFKRWVTHEVLPLIRKYGFYATDVVIDNLLNNPDTIIGILEAYKHERDMHHEAQTKLDAATIRLDEHGQWMSIKRVAALNHWRWQDLDWRRLKAASHALGYGVQKVDDKNYGKVNAYHIDVWQRVYPNLRLCAEAVCHE
jgi:prophage antirepressor-like protein